MRKVFGSANLIEVKTVQHLLDAAGIATELRNEHTGTMLPLGDLSEIELRVKDARQAEAAEAVVRDYVNTTRSADDTRPDWRCTPCGDSSPASFDVCWQCGAERA